MGLMERARENRERAALPLRWFNFGVVGPDGFEASALMLVGIFKW